METNKLRIGNRINYDDKHGFINAEKIEAINHSEWIDGTKQWWIETENLEGELFNEQFTSIPLTREWYDRIERPDDADLSWIYSGTSLKVFCKGTLIIIIRTVDRYENFYFALTEKELIIKPEKQ